MGKLIKKIKIKKQDGTFTDYIPIGAEAKNIETNDGESVQLKLNKKPYYYKTVADMKADTKLKSEDTVITLGYYSANDGGGATYKITDIESQSEYQEKINNNLYATLIVEDEINILQLGAKSDDNTFDNYDILNTLFNLGNFTIFIPKGKFYVNNTITCLKSKKIYGNGALVFINNTGNGLILGDSIELKGIEINCGDGFTGTLLQYDGEIGERTYPSIAKFSDLVISSNTSNQIECLFDFKPWRNYGIVIENIKIGKQGDVRKANYGFKVDTSNWANGISINTMIIDIMGNDIIPLYLNNTATTNNSGWNIKNLFIQVRNAIYNYVAYFNKYSYFTLDNCRIYDVNVGTLTNNYSVLYDYCAYINASGSEAFRVINNQVTNPVSSNSSREAYKTELFNGVTINPYCDSIDLSSYSNKVVPLFFPIGNDLTARNEIEINTRYVGQNRGNYLKLISTIGATSKTTWYNRNFYLEANKYNTQSVIQKIENVYEGTIIWVRGGMTIYYNAKCFSKPTLGIGKTVTELGTGTEKTLSAIDIDENTVWLPATTYPLYFYGVKEINNNTFNQGV